MSRAQIIDDSFNLGKAEIIDQSIYLEIIDYIKHEKDYLPIQAAFHGLEFIGQMLSKRPEFEKFKVNLNFFL